MYVVTGVTGNTGSVVANRLLDAGKKVRVIVRSAEKGAGFAKRGAEVAVADLSDERALEAALKDAEGLYLLSPPDLVAKSFIAERKLLTERIAKAIERAKVRHVVLLSSVAAHRTSGTGPILTVHNAEAQLRAVGVPTTFVRAAYFVENWSAVMAVAKKDGVLPSFLPEGLRIPMVAARDIGVVAAQALLDGPRGNRVIELSGPQDVSPTDVAATVGTLLGRTVKVVEAPLDAVVPTFTGFGFSENVAGLFREMYAGVASGVVSFEGRGESARGATTVEEALRPFV